MRTTLFGLFTVLILGSSSIASAGYFTVCADLSYFDARQNTLNGTGSLLKTSFENTDKPFQDLRVQLWDMDGSCVDSWMGCSETAGDDLLKDWTYTDSNGRACFNSVGGYEDIYMVVDMKTHSGEIQREYQTVVYKSPVIDDFGVGLNNVFDFDFKWSISCWLSMGWQSGPTSSGSGICGSKPSMTSWYATATQESNILATMSDASRFGTSVIGSENYTFYLEPNGPSGCDASWNGSNNSVTNDGEICILRETTSSGGAYANHRVAHEIGHVVMRRALGVSLSPDCSSGHYWQNRNQSEKCAVSEGWANFFASAIFFEPSAVNPYYVNLWKKLEGDVSECRTSSNCLSGEVCLDGLCTIEDTQAPCLSNSQCGSNALCGSGTCKIQESVLAVCTLTGACGSGYDCNDNMCELDVLTCSISSECEYGDQCVGGYCETSTSTDHCMFKNNGPEDVEGNISRFFWDLYDSTTEDDSFNNGYYGSDSAQMTMNEIVDVWREFANVSPSTANRAVSESGEDGRNAWDFVFHEMGARSELYLNCLCGQQGPVTPYSCSAAY